MPNISRQRKRQQHPSQCPEQQQEQSERQQHQHQHQQQQQSPTPHQSFPMSMGMGTDQYHTHTNTNTKHKKSPSVSFNIGRIMPRNIAQDKEHLYQQNMKLKEELQMYKSQVVQLKTKLNANEKEMEKVVGEVRLMQGSLGRNSSSRAIMRRNGSMTQHSNLQTQAYMKKLLRQSKDAESILAQQNTRLKKLVKYTEISQLRIHNQQLSSQCTRLAGIIESKVLDQDQYVSEYEQEIAEIKRVLDRERENNRYMCGQVQMRDKQMQQYERQIRQAGVRQNKIKREITELRKLTKNNSNNNNINNNGNSKNKRLSKQSQASTQKDCHKCLEYSEQLVYYKMKAEQLQQIISNNNIDNKSSIKIDISNAKSQQKPHNSVSKSNSKSVGNNKSMNKDINGNSQKTQNILKQQQQQKDSKNAGNNEDYEQQYGDQQFDDQQQQNKQKQQQQQQGQYDDDFDKDKNSKSNNNNYSYEQQFDEIDNDNDDNINDDDSQNEEVLSTKNKDKSKDNDKDKNKNKSKMNNSKGGQQLRQSQLSLQQIIKQTLAYRLRAQSYSYQDLTTDIKQSNVAEFTASQLATILGQEPFFLVDDQLVEVLTYIFGHSDIQMDQKVKSKNFLKRVKLYCIDEIQQFQPEQSQQIQKVCTKVLEKHRKKLHKKFKQSSTDGTISKHKFTQILTSQGLTQPQVDYLLGYASLVSKSLQQIDYQQFLSRVSK